jgi:hypothetical protein
MKKGGFQLLDIFNRDVGNGLTTGRRGGSWVRIAERGRGEGLSPLGERQNCDIMIMVYWLRVSYTFSFGSLTVRCS